MDFRTGEEEMVSFGGGIDERLGLLLLLVVVVVAVGL